MSSVRTRRACLSVVVLLACTPDHDPLDSDTATSTSTTTSASGPATTATTSTEPTTDASPPPPDLGTTPQRCDLWLDDCPEGQKCMPASLDGDNAWESHICVPLAPESAGLGEPCRVLGSPVGGEDTCGEHLMCWNLDPDTLEGTCTAMCTGSPSEPACPDPGHVCTLSSDAILLLCVPVCDPLAQDCPPGDVCIPWPGGGPSIFHCARDGSGDEGQLYEPCQYANACDPGLYCLHPELADECDPASVGCCLPFCDTESPECPGAGQQCLPWYDPNQAPPGGENIGVCGLP